MEFIKNNKPAILVAAGVAIAAGYFALRGRKGDPVSDNESEVCKKETEPEALENNFFLDPSASTAQNE
jgi:hypothetical protein